MPKQNRNTLLPPAEAGVDPSFVSNAKDLSLNFNSTAPSTWYQSFGFDQLRATTGQVADAATTAGWRETGIDSLMRMNEIRRAEELTNYTDDELRVLYRRKHAGSRGGGVSKEYLRPSLEEFGLTERPTMIQPDEANTKYGISGHLSWDKPVSSLVASIQHRRKLEEIRLASTMDRAQGFVDNGIGFGLAMGTAIVDPVGLLIGAIPLVGEARYAKMGVSMGRFFRGAEAGFVGSLGVEPLIYAAKTQEKADYDMYDSLMNVTFGTVAGGGLFTVGGKIADGIKGIRTKSHQAALESAIKQLSSGRDVEVGHIAGHQAANQKPVAVNFDGEGPTPPKMAPDPNNPAAGKMESLPKDDPVANQYNPVQEFKPAKDVDVSLALMEQATTGRGATITAAQVTKALDNPQFREAVEMATQNKIGNNVAFYVRTQDGKVMVVRPTGRGPVSLLSSPSFSKGGTINMAKISEDLKDLLAVHGLSADKDMAMDYKGSYQLKSGTLTHVLEINNIKFDPLQNQNHVMFGPEDMVKNMFAQDPADQVFTDLNPKGSQAVNAALFNPDTYLSAGDDSKYKSFAGYDSTIEIKNLKNTGPQLGSNKGGTFMDMSDGSSVYVKFQDADHSMNEWIAATLYRWFGVPVPKTTIVTEAGKTIGVAADLLPVKSITPAEFEKLPKEIKRDFVKHLMIDAYLANWDVVGNAPNFNIQQLPNGQIWRLDPGGALMFRAQGALKGEKFGPQVKEFKTLQDKNPEVFGLIDHKAIEESVIRILRVPQDEVNKLIDTAVLHGLDPKLANGLKEVMQYRRLDLEKTFPEAAVKAAKEQGLVKFTSTYDASQFLNSFKKELEMKLTTAELSKLKGYTGSAYVGINNYLWGRKVLNKAVDDDMEKTIGLIDSAFDKMPGLTQPMEVWRGNVRYTTFNPILEQLGLKQFIWDTQMNGVDAYNMLKATVGWTIDMHGYTSTSFVEQTAKNFHTNAKAPMTKILLPENTKALMLGAISGHSEAEILLARDMTFRVKEVLPPTTQHADPVLVLEVVDKNSAPPLQMSDAEQLKIAKAYHQRATNAADPEPLLNEPKDAVGDTLKGMGDDLNMVNKDLEDLQANLDAELANMDPELANAVKGELDAQLKVLNENQANAQDMYKAAQAAAVCITKGM